jgi:predicted phage terminase large subunit-like protein
MTQAPVAAKAVTQAKAYEQWLKQAAQVAVVQNIGKALRLNKYIPIQPTPRQAVFLSTTQKEVFYGGAVAGGKSAALLAAALQYVDEPDYAALLLRRTYSDLALPGALMERAQDWLQGTDAHWNDTTKTWKFPSGATLTFGYLEAENDRYRYQSAEFQFVGFDELSQFSEHQYQYLFSRLRRLKSSIVPIRMRSASNPGGSGHQWVRQRFLVEGPANGRIIIRAALADNPHVDAKDYIKSLNELDPVTRHQLLNGDWDVTDKGSKFQRGWFEILDAVPAGLSPIRVWDFAASEVKKKNNDPDWTAGALVAFQAGRLYLLNIVRTRSTPADVEALVKQTAMLDGRDIPIHIEQEPGASGLSLIDHYQREVLPGYAVFAFKPSGSKEVRAMPTSAAAQNGNFKILRGRYVNDFLDEAELFPMEGYGIHNDQIDAVSAGHTILAEGFNAVFAPAVGGERQVTAFGQLGSGTAWGPGYGFGGNGLPMPEVTSSRLFG